MTDPIDLMSSADDLAGVASLAADPQRCPRQMAEITDLLADELAKSRPELGPEQARALAGRQMARLAREFGGGNFYLPKGDALERALRDLRLWSDFDGTIAGPGGVETLARREGLTTIHVYRILAVQRDLHRARVQGDLFGTDDRDPPRA